jgi:hypothetical protein
MPCPTNCGERHCRFIPSEDDKHYHNPQVSQSSFSVSESTSLAEYHEWPFHGFLKRTMIGDEITYNLKFNLPRVLECLKRPIVGGVYDVNPNQEASAQAASPYSIPAHSKVDPSTQLSQKKRVPWTPEEDATVVKMKQHGCSWKQLYSVLPHRAIGMM